MKISNILIASCGFLISTSFGMTWDEADIKARKFIKDLTNEEKISLTTGTDPIDSCAGGLAGIPRKNLNKLCIHDGPSGVRSTNATSTTWEVGINNAATFNKDLLYEIGKGQGEEFYKKGVHIALTPAMNLVRAPTGGRIWESYSEDPYLSGVCGSTIIKGMQDQGIVATAKHFVGNEQEFNREASSSNIDEQTLMEVYVEPFYMSINDGEVASVMAGFNALNGVYLCKNKKIITDLLKEKLNFQGPVMSDWYAIKDIDSFNAGMDMNMPGGENYTYPVSKWGNNIDNGIKDGIVDQKRLDDAALRVMRALYKVGIMDNKNFPKTNLLEPIKHLETHRQAAIESHVLLKNEDILPLNKKVKKIAVIGSDAAKPKICDKKPCLNNYYMVSSVIRNGTVIHGWGSGSTDIPEDVSVPVDEIVKRAKKACITVVKSETDDIEVAVTAAKEVDTAIVFVRSNSGELLGEPEGGDRLTLDLWSNGNALVEAVANVNKNVIVVIHAPGPVNLPFIDKVKAIVYAGMPGQEAGIAITSILFGDATPSGHLPFTWGDVNDYCCKTITGISLPGGGPEMTQYDYDEGLFVGYRWFAKYGKIPTFPFGYGLSYTTFKYSGLKSKLITKKNEVTGLEVSFTVKNTGKVEGSAVPMLFITFPDDKELGDYPPHILKGFEKVSLKPKKSKRVTITVDQHHLSYYNVKKGKFVVPVGGVFTIYIGENANNVVLTQSIKNTQKK